MPDHSAEARGALILFESLMLLLVEKGLVAQEEREEVFETAVDTLRRSDPPDDEAAALIDRIRGCGNSIRRQE